MVQKIRLKDIKFGRFDRPKKTIPDNDKEYNWTKLVDSIKKEGFTPEKYGYITISKDGYCLNGHHRYTVLKELYGENYEIKVFRKKMYYLPEVILHLFFYIIIVKPISFLFTWKKK